MAFLNGIRRGHYRNNKYPTKATIEILGSAITATFLTSLVSDIPTKYCVAIACCVGMSWSGIVQMTRTKITTKVENALSDGK